MSKATARTRSFFALFVPPPVIDLSPLIPLPLPSASRTAAAVPPAFTSSVACGPAVDDGQATISEHALRKYHRSWLQRESNLIVRLRALEAATMKGQATCWAGRVEQRSKVRPARQEAKYVVGVLSHVLRWCDSFKGIRESKTLEGCARSRSCITHCS